MSAFRETVRPVALHDTPSKIDVSGDDKTPPADELDSELDALQLINERLRRAILQNASFVDSPETSKANSIRLAENEALSGFETPPGLTTSPCSTPSNADVATPPSGAKLTNYFPPLAGFGKSRKARLTSPLGTGRTGTPLSSEHSLTFDQAQPESIHNDTASLEVAREVVIEDLSARPRSASMSQLQGYKSVQQQERPRSSSLPPLVDQNVWFRSEKPRREIVLPGVLPFSQALRQENEDAIESASEPDVATAANEKPASEDSSKASVWSRAKATYTSTYCPSEPPPLILPTAPTDAEKTLYLKTNRVGLYTFGVFSFLSLSAGMWLFVISSVVFYWFGAFVGLLQIYLIISYTVSMLGKDYDYEEHKRMVQDNLISQVTAPTVDIYLPCCKEPIEVLENTYKHIQQLQWPEGKLKVYVLDDGASEAVRSMAGLYGFNYICREDRPRLKKAGNLRWAFARTQGDFFAIFDADFCPRPDFLHEIMPIHMRKTDTAIVQTPQYFRITDDQTWVEQGAGAVQELFYRVVQVNRNRWGASICVGSNAVYRREALVEVGGTAEIGFSEDVHTGFYAVNRGWKVRYLPLCLACGICPDTPRAFFSQQMRWCMGSTTLLTNMDFWRSRLTAVQKICYLSGMMYYSAISLSIFISPLPGILMLWARPDFVKYYNLAFAIPSIFYSIIAMRCWAKASYGFNVQHVMVIQSYAYLTAIKDRLFGRALAWVPTGDSKAHKNNKYRNMRILAVCWTTTIIGVMIAGVVYQTLRGALHWYDCVPLEALMLLNLYLSHRFLFWHGKV